MASRWPLHSEARVRFQASSCKIFGAQDSIGRGFSTSNSDVPCMYNFTNVPYSSSSHLLEIHPNITHPFTPRSPQWSLSLRFPHQDPIRPLSSPIYATCPAHLILLDFVTRNSSDVTMQKLESPCVVSKILIRISCKNISIVFNVVGFQFVYKLAGTTKG